MATISSAAKEQEEEEEEGFDKLSAEEGMKFTAPRKLTKHEASSLCKLMKKELNVVDEETDDDADTLLDYSIDMIDGGKSIDMVIKEVSAFCS